MVLPLPACQCPEYEVAYQPAGRGIPPPPQRGCRVGDPGPWRRCSSLKYSRYSRSSRLASRAPRSGILATYFALGTLERLQPTDDDWETEENRAAARNGVPAAAEQCQKKRLERHLEAEADVTCFQ